MFKERFQKELFIVLRIALLGFFTPLLFTEQIFAEQDYSSVEIKTQKVAEGIYMLQGAGGNIGLSVGVDGVFMIDDQFAPLSEKIQAAISALSDQPIRFLLNTHWHFDHTGANEAIAQTGAIIVAHDNVHERLRKGGTIAAFSRDVPPASADALPVVTFSESVTFHWNGDTLSVLHPESAHTDGDAIIFFEKANVLHTGDLYFNGFYPFIDASSGGSVKGILAGVEQVLARINEQTKIIPGHGALSNKAELIAYRDMLKTVYGRVKALKDQGKTVDEAVALKPTADFDAQWGGGFLAPDVWVKIIYAAI